MKRPTLAFDEHILRLAVFGVVVVTAFVFLVFVLLAPPEGGQRTMGHASRGAEAAGKLRKLRKRGTSEAASVASGPLEAAAAARHRVAVAPRGAGDGPGPATVRRSMPVGWEVV